MRIHSGLPELSNFVTMTRVSTCWFFSVLFVLVTVVNGSVLRNNERVLYSGYHVMKATTNHPEYLEFLMDNNDLLKVNIWRVGRDVDGQTTITFHARPDVVESITRTLASRGVTYQILSRDLQSDIDLHAQMNAKARKEDDPFSSYYDFDELQQFLNDQAALCGSNCQVIQIGASFEGRPLNAIKLVGAETPGCSRKPAIWIDAGIHAREWISVSTAQFIINRLIEEYDTDPFIKELRDIYDWFILPSVNPDGYVHSWTTNRMWRKTRQTYDGVVCVGADANRNFDFQWMTVGASSTPCSETYAGPKPNSEPEADAVSTFLLARNGTWDLFITLHSYGQLWMAPYGYTTELPENYETLEKVGLAAVQAIADTSGETYTFGTAAGILYQSSGTSRDWAAGVPRIPYVYTIELRNTESFDLPPTEIRPTGEEIWAGLKAAAAVLRQEKPGVCIEPPRV